MPTAVLRDLDDRTIAAVSSCVGRSSIVDRSIAGMASHLAKVDILLLAALFVGGSAGDRRRHRETALRVACVLPVTIAVVAAVGGLAGRRRPFADDDAVTALLNHAPGRSFPSRHAACAAAMATVALRGAPRIGWIMAMAAALLAGSRVYAGLHYPTDVVAGSAIGIGLGMLARQKGAVNAVGR